MYSVLGGILGIALGVLFIIGLDVILDRWHERDRRPGFIDQADPRPRNIPMFCADCGKAMVSLRSQDGFDMKTGEPVFAYDRACADATNAPGQARRQAWPMCGQRVAQGPIPLAHNHVDAEATSMTCPVCIDVMFQNGVLNPEEILKLYSAAGVASRRSNDPYDDLLTQRGYLLSTPSGYIPNP